MGRAVIRGGVVLTLLLGVGCDASEPLAGGLVLGTIDASRLCDVDTMELRLHARWQACPEQEPECEVPSATEVEGDRFSCPASGPTVELGVELPSPGRYQIEVQAVQASGPARIECFVDPLSGDTRVELPTQRLLETSFVALEEHGACP